MTKTASHDRRGRYDFALGEKYDLDDQRYDFDSEDLDWEDEGDFDSDYVGGVFGRYGLSGGDFNENAVKYHGLVQTFVNTFTGEGRRYSVTFDPDVSTAGTSFEGRSVVITTRPLADPALADERRGEILTAMAAHEVSHDRYGIGTAEAVRAALPGDRTAAILSNILDDVRIEKRFVEEYPGYRGIFDPMLEYVADGGSALDASAEAVNVAVSAIRYDKWTRWDPALETERQWWRQWARRNARHDSPARHVAAVREALDHIGPRPQPEPERPTCGHGAGQTHESAAGDRQAQEAVVAAQRVTDNGPYGKVDVVTSTRGMLDGFATPVVPSGPASAAVRAAFMRSRTGHTAVSRGQRTGRLDQRGLHRIAQGRGDVFERRRAPSPKRVRVWFMADQSSSMDSSLADVARTAMAIADGVRSEQHVEMSVWSWTNPPYGDAYSGIAQVRAVRVWTSGEPVSKIAELTALPTSGTPDAAALHWAARAIRAECRDGEKPVIIFGSDGFGDSAMADEVRAARAAGVDVRSVALGRIDRNRQEQVYGRGGYAEWAGSIEATARPMANMIVEATR